MGTWEVYCGVCSGPLTAFYCKVDRQNKTGGIPSSGEAAGDEITVWDDPDPLDATDSDGEDDESEQESTTSSKEKPSVIEDTDEEFCEYYDSSVITRKELRWVDTSIVVAYNAKKSRAYLSGPGTSDNTGQGTWQLEDDADPDEPMCYVDYWRNKEPCYPFHIPCYRLLCKCLAVYSNTVKPDLNTLYRTCAKLGDGPCKLLSVYRGPVGEFGDQSWINVRGEEILVSNPMARRGIASFVRQKLVASCFKRPAAFPVVDAPRTIGRDMFSKLPLELVEEICSALGYEDIDNLVKASWWVHCMLRNHQTFWTKVIRTHLKWFPELEILVADEAFMADKDARQVFRWALASTTVDRNMKRPYAVLANTRRIWKAAEDIAKEYFGILAQERRPIVRSTSMDEETGESDSDSDFDDHEVGNTRQLIWPSPSLASKRPERSVWGGSARTYQELLDSHGVLNVYWCTRYAILTGISMTLDDEETMFGTGDELEEARMETIILGDGEWIDEIVFCLSAGDSEVVQNELEFERQEGQLELGKTLIAPIGIKVICTSGRVMELGRTDRASYKAPVKPGNDYCIIGLHGQIAVFDRVGVIPRIGVMQAEKDPDVDMDDWDPEPSPLVSSLWADDCVEILGRPVWDEPSFRAVDCAFGACCSADTPDDLLLRHPFIWAKSEEEARKIRRISAYERVVDAKRHFGGLRVEYTAESSIPSRYAGTATEQDGTEWKKEHTVCFDIDGPAGEVITEANAYRGLPWCIKLRTNRGREVIFGSQMEQGADIKAYDAGMIHGFIMSFGKCYNIDSVSFWSCTHVQAVVSLQGADVSEMGIDT